MTSLLSQIYRTSERLRPRKVFLYGPPGIGKSTFVSRAPGAVFLPIEDGLRNLDVASFPLATSFGQVMQSLYELATQPHDFLTLGIDSVDWLETLIHQSVAEDAGKNDIGEISYGKGFDAATSKWNLILAWLDKLANDRNMMMMMIGHSKVEKFSDPRTDAYDRYSPRLHKTSSCILQEWADDVLFANYKVFTKTEDLGFNKTKTRGIGNGQRILHTTERPTHLAKNKLGEVGMPDEIPLDFAEYWKYASQRSTQLKPVSVVAPPSPQEPVVSFEQQAAEKF